MATTNAPTNHVLHVAPAAFGVRNASPFALKAETLMRLSGVPFEARPSDPRRGPRQKLPFLETPGGAVIADSRNIHAYLERAHGLRLAAGPHDTLVRRIVEEHLYWLQVSFRWNHHPDAVRDGFFGGVPAPFRGLVFGMVRKQVRASLWGQGTGRRPEDEQLALAHEDLDALERALGAGPFLGGDALSVADASTHGLLSQLLGDLDDPLTRAVRARAGLVAYHRRVEAAVYGDDTAVREAA